MSFVIGVKFGYSWTFFKMKKYDRALEEFQHLQKANIFYPLSASHYYTAQCYLKLRRYMYMYSMYMHVHSIHVLGLVFSHAAGDS